MIEYLEGRIDSLQPAAAVIDTGGIGYLVNISLNTYEALQGRERARVLVHESIREDAWVLYGFADERERDIKLIRFAMSRGFEIADIRRCMEVPEEFEAEE